jgi:tRNA (guanine-N7-)-methyltransferase
MFALLISFMRGRTELGEDEAAVEYIPKCVTETLDFADIFPRELPVEIDLGCGDGTFLTAMAMKNSSHNFLGVERLLGRVRSTCRRVARLNVKNARVLRIESSYAVANLLPRDSVTAFHLLFPDPWPKRRHQRRRSFTEEFLLAIHGDLIADGLLHIATDDAEYFRHIKSVIAAAHIFATSHEQNNFPPSSFEQKFVASGLPIHRMFLRKTSPVK